MDAPNLGRQYLVRDQRKIDFARRSFDVGRTGAAIERALAMLVAA